MMLLRSRQISARRSELSGEIGVEQLMGQGADRNERQNASPPPCGEGLGEG
jgi:hypothetical protein